MSDRPGGARPASEPIEPEGRTQDGRDQTEVVLEEALPEEDQRRDQLDDDPDKRPEPRKPARP